MKPRDYGRTQGFITIPEPLLAHAHAEASAFWASQVEKSFSEDLVSVSFLPPELSLECIDWLPHDHLRKLSFTTSPNRRNYLVATAGVDYHVDSVLNHSLVWVLVNDNLFFQSKGGTKHIHRPSSWFIFDDSVAHQVNDHKTTPKGQAVYLAWTVELSRLT